jgi:hypothetical protein
MLGPLMTTDMEDVSVTLGCDQARSRTVVFKHSVGCYGGPMKDVVNVRRIDSKEITRLLQAGNHTARWVLQRGRYFMNPGFA